MSEQVKEESEGMEFMPEQEYLSAQDLAATMSSAEIEKLKSGGTAKSILYMIGALFMGGMVAIGGLAFVVGSDVRQPRRRRQRRSLLFLVEPGDLRN